MFSNYSTCIYPTKLVQACIVTHVSTLHDNAYTVTDNPTHINDWWASDRNQTSLILNLIYINLLVIDYMYIHASIKDLF